MKKINNIREIIKHKQPGNYPERNSREYQPFNFMLPPTMPTAAMRTVMIVDYTLIPFNHE